MSDPSAPPDEGDLVQLSGGRIARVVDVNRRTDIAYMELVFGELQPDDTVYYSLVFKDRFHLTKIILAEDTNG